MKISFNWIKQFIKTDWNAEKAGELLTDLGLEVEGITTYQSVKGGLDGVVVGEILTCIILTLGRIISGSGGRSMNK